jgi:glutamine cyclotransferase
VDGVVYANVWQTDDILRIDPRDGRVTAVVDASGLLTREERLKTDVLNGIAWDPESRTFLLTGKLWPKLFQVRLVPAR